MTRATPNACIAACHVCAAECGRHAGRHKHWRSTVEAAQICEDACRDLLIQLG